MSYISDFKSSPISLFGVNGGVNTTDASVASLVGSEFRSADGRRFALVQVGGTAIASGLMVQSPASIGANHTGLTPTANAAIGATSIGLTSGGTVVTTNQYQGGYAVISAGTGIGQTLRIASNTSATASGTFTITLEDPLSVAIVASNDSKVSLTLPQYGSPNGTNVSTSGVVVNPVTATGRTIGATIYPLTASTSTVANYGFIQTAGAVGVLNDATTAIGLDVMPSSNTAGAVMTYVVATRSRVGTSTVAGETTKAQLITLQL